MAVFQDPEYHKTIVPDEEKFIYRESGKFIFGFEEVKFDHA